MSRRRQLEAERRQDCDAIKESFEVVTATLGHDMAWRLGPDSKKKGCAYHWIGDCVHCGANMVVLSAGSSCQGVRDARRATCTGPGTAILTEIEQQRRLELAAEAVTRFGRDMAANLRLVDGDPPA